MPTHKFLASWLKVKAGIGNMRILVFLILKGNHTLCIRVRATHGYGTPTTRGTLLGPSNDEFSLWGPRFRFLATSFFFENLVLGPSRGLDRILRIWIQVFYWGFWTLRFRFSKVLRTSLVSRPHSIYEISFKSINCQLDNNCHRLTDPTPPFTKHTTKNGQCLEKNFKHCPNRHHYNFNYVYCWISKGSYNKNFEWMFRAADWVLTSVMRVNGLGLTMHVII